MRYANLNALYHGSRSSRKFFLSQSVDIQLLLGERGEYIHSAQELHLAVFAIEKELHMKELCQ